MDARRDIEKRVEKERHRIADMRDELTRAEAFVLGLEEALKILPKDATARKPSKAKGTIRPGSEVARIRDIMAQVGRPMRIEQILMNLGKPDTKQNRASVAGSLGRYVRRGQVFSRVGPNQFFLLGAEAKGTVELPPGFGAEEIPPADPDELPF